jgi:hypothetical protein
MISEKNVEIKKNKSLFYITPILNKYIGFEFLEFLHNSYMMNNGDEKQFSVLYQFNGVDRKFTEFEERIFKHKLFLGHEDQDKYVLYKFKLPDEVKKAKEYCLTSTVHLNSLENKLLIKSFAKKINFSDPELFNKFLKGTNKISKTDMEMETFSNWVSQISFKNADDLYKEKNE